MPGIYALIWDAPNMDMGLGAILGGRPTAAYRPRFEVLGRWVAMRAQQRHATPQASVFTNVAPGGADAIRSWVEAIRNVGFGVFAKPKPTDPVDARASDVDVDMLNYLDSLHDQLTGVVVASADGQNFAQTLETLAAEGVAVTVLGFREHCAWAQAHPDFEFVDLEDIEGVFRDPLPRINLDNLPPEGAWLPPFKPLTV